MPSRLALLLLAAAALGCAHASRELEEAFPSGRQLLQAPDSVDCNRSVANCDACRYQFYKGTVTKAICTRCLTGYTVRNSGRACYCAPGYYSTNDTSLGGQVGFKCIPCGFNNYCPGAKVTAESSTVMYPCGAHKITTTEYAKSDRECVVEPGFGWGPGETSDACPIGFYNPGYNTRKCTKCPGSLTTDGPNSNSTQDCVAPEGYYYLRGKAVACARGTYKSYKGNNDCDECPTGITTAAGAVAKVNKNACEVVLPGYSLKGNPVLGVDNATECPQDSYRVGEFTVTNTSSATGCLDCDNFMVTLPNVTQATTSDACLVPPGYGWKAPTGADTKGTAEICQPGFYNPGYNREPCIKCGNGTITTESTASTSADQCYTPAGHGNRRDPITGTLFGFICPNGTYGRPNNTYGLVDVECTKCLEHTHTVALGSTNETACLTDPGYGWDDGQVNQCDFGYYNPGENQNKCNFCGDFMNTTNTANATAGEQGSDNILDCKIDFGYQPGAVTGTIEPCLQGWYKDAVGNQSCAQCPSGTSTTIALAAVAKSDCDVCRPGFGIGGIANISLSNPSCSLCQTGTYSPGMKRDGENCTVCPQTQNFTGEMVSRQGATSPEECFGEFITDEDNMQNFLWWDIIAMNDSSTFVHKSALQTLINCQRGCGSDPNCQYFEFYETGAPDGDLACYWRDNGAITTGRIGDNKPLSWWDAPDDLTSGTGIVMFEIREGSYVVYPKKDGEQIGAPLTLAGASADKFNATRNACDKAPDCIGLTWHSINGWSAFKGALWEDAVGKVRVVGNRINSWVNVPTGLEMPEGWTPTN